MLSQEHLINNLPGAARRSREAECHGPRSPSLTKVSITGDKSPMFATLFRPLFIFNHYTSPSGRLRHFPSMLRNVMTLAENNPIPNMTADEQSFSQIQTRRTHSAWTLMAVECESITSKPIRFRPRT